MSQQAMPNPIELYEAAVKKTRVIIAGVKSNQLEDPTPCTEWNVQALMDHLIGSTAHFEGALSSKEPQQPPKAGSAAEAFDAGTAGVIKAAKSPGALEKRVQTPFGEMSGGELLFGAFMDTVIHGWDLAKATGQNTRLDDRMVEILHTAFAPHIEELRGTAFGPAVEVPANASKQDKLLGMMGRKP